MENSLLSTTTTTSAPSSSPSLSSLISTYNLQNYSPDTADTSNVLLIAGRLGKALLKEHDDLQNLHQVETKKLRMEIEDLKHQIDVMFQQNRELLAHNDLLLSQSAHINQSLISSDNTISHLNENVSKVTELSSKLNYFMSQSATLENEISLLETSRENLENLVEERDKEKSRIQVKYNKTSHQLNELILQYHSLEDTVAHSENMNSFVATIISENSRLHRTVKKLTEQLASTQNEVIQLKQERGKQHSSLDRKPSFSSDVSFETSFDLSNISEEDTEITIPDSPNTSTVADLSFSPFNASTKSVASSNISVKSGQSIPETMKRPSEPALSAASLSCASARPQASVTNKSSSKDLLFAAVANSSSSRNNNTNLKHKSSNWSNWLRIAR